MVTAWKKRVLISVLGAALAFGSAPADAQLLGGVSNLPVVGGLRGTLQNTVDGLGRTTTNGLERLHDAVGRPLTARRGWDKDPLGAPVVRAEILAVAPSETALAAARDLGLTTLRTETIEPLGLTVVVWRVPDTTTLAAVMARLRAADPQGQFDYNHIYNPSGALQAPVTGAPVPEAAVKRIGMIDAGVDARHPALSPVRIEAAGFVDGCKPAPSDHGTAVAFLLAGHEQSPSALYAADVFCGRPDGGNAEAMARAMGWLASARVPVINISLAGPPNVLVAAATKALLARGHVIVAAAGNDGPAAGVRYPAAYPGVVAVTTVDEANRIEIDAAQGAQIAFAARGVKVRAAKAGGGYAVVTGTSFAAPVVARRFAVLVDNPDSTAAARSLCILQNQAIRLGASTRDPVYGYGLLAEDNSRVPAQCGRILAIRQPGN